MKVGLGALAGVAAIFVVRSAGRKRRLGDIDPFEATAASEDPYAPPPDEPEYENGCLLLGKYWPNVGGLPYRVCLTENQEQTLFGGKRKSQKKLGCGVFACAYTSPDESKAVKFTRDSEDVAALLKAQKTGVVPKIYKVFKLKQGGRTLRERDPFTRREIEPQDTPVYALVMEKLRTIPSDEREMLDETLPGIRSVAQGKISASDFCEQQQHEDGGIGCGDVETDVINAVEKLKRAGITWEDIHSGNIGYDRSGALKVLDLGLTKTELKRRIKILAGLGRPKTIKRARTL